MIWVVAGGVAIVIVATAVVVAMRSRKQEPKAAAAGQPEEPDPIFILGIVFVGAGVALFVTLGPIMFFMPVLGFIYMALGIANMRKRTH